MGHGHSHAAGRAEDRRRLKLVLAITGAVLLVELLGAWLAGSLALLADAAHMGTDVAAIVLALGASYVATRPAGPRSTFGWHRAEILAALLNAAVLLVVCGYLLWAGARRLVDPQPVEPLPMVVFGGIAALASGFSLLVLQRSTTGSLNLRGAATEVFADLLGSVLAVLAGVVIWLSGFDRADPLASLLIALMILPRSVWLLRDAAVVLLEIAPRDLDLAELERRLCAVPGVVDVHDVHAWTITSGIPSFSAHVRVTDEALAEEGVGRILDRLSECAAAEFGIDHATFQVEPLHHQDHEHLGDAHH
jgi:cobalt-zinc-cadmium efflux system protein